MSGTEDELKFFNVPNTNAGNFALRTPTNRSVPLQQVIQQGVPQEQYDALKAKFAAHDLTIRKHEEAVEDLNKEIKKREEQIQELETVFQQRMKAAENVQNLLRQEARDAVRQHESDLRAKDDVLAKRVQEDLALLQGVQQELAGVKQERDTLFSEKMKVEEVVDSKDSQIQQL